MNARRILDKLKQAFLKQNKPPTLGRWNIHSHKKTILKIKYANEDNCGISGNNSKNTNDDQYIYMMGYESIHN
jgi:hypothetical protein